MSSNYIYLVYKVVSFPVPDSKIIQHLYDINAGSTFGELALIRNMVRNFTVICKGNYLFKFTFFIESVYPKTESEWSSNTWMLILHHEIILVYTGDSEFLSLSKDEFNSILRKDYEDSWNKRLDFFQNSVYFEKLSDDQKRQMADMSEIREYSNNRVHRLTDQFYFISQYSALSYISNFNNYFHSLKHKLIRKRNH